MATPAQITANRLNAQLSTGPVTPAGKQNASRNATKSGLFSKRDYVTPENRDGYEELKSGLLADLEPRTALQHVLAAEIISAAWRLELCAQNEANLPDADELRAIDRARSAAFRILTRARRAYDELRGGLKARELERLLEPQFPVSCPVQNEPNPPARNAPCPCGSGLKYKRCCARPLPHAA